jgi:hypothetical protein
MIKPIETRYKGYLFRSRLEARWAVFLDTLDIEYEYEPQGFDLGEAGWYLPDFYLPKHDTHRDCGVWLEIKPEGCLLAMDEYLEKEVYRHRITAPPFTECEVRCLALAENGEEVHVIYGSPLSPSLMYAIFYGWGMSPGRPGSIYRFGKSDNEIDAALVAARSARFEHGESGAPR